MTKALSLCGLALAVWVMAASLTTPAPSAASARMVVAEYMRAVPAGPSAVRRCKRICVKSGGGTPTHPPHCRQWQTVC